MKLSETRSFNNFLSNSPGYSFLVLYMQLTVFMTFVILLNMLLPGNISSLFLMAGGIVSILAASVYYDMMKDIRPADDLSLSGSGGFSRRLSANILGGIIIALAVYAGVSLFLYGITWRTFNVPVYVNIIIFLYTVCVWVGIVFLKQLLNARERFEIYTKLYQENILKEKLLDDPALEQYTLKNIKNVQRDYFIQIAIIWLLAFVCNALKIKFSFILNTLLFIITAGGVCVFGYFEIIKWEQYYAYEGADFSSFFRNRRIVTIAAFSLFCIIAALFAASGNNILPFSIIAGFFKWLFAFLKPKSPIIIDKPEGSNLITDKEFNLEPVFDTPPEENVWISYFWLFLKYTLIFIVVGSTALYIIYLFVRNSKNSEKLKFQRLRLNSIFEWFAGLLAAIISFFSSLKNNNAAGKKQKIDSNEIKRAASDFYGNISAVKKRDVRREANLFSRLIVWGAEIRNVAWKPVLAPVEYCDLLAAVSKCDNEIVMQQNAEITNCGILFEKILYSGNGPTDDDRKEFKNLVNKIINYPAVEL